MADERREMAGGRWPFLAAGLGLAVCAALLSFRLISQGDTFAWLAVGRWIAEHRAAPHVNLFMYTTPHFPWVTHEWLFALIVFGVHRAAGLVGTQVMVFAAVLGAFVILLRLWRRMGVSAALAPAPFLLAMALMADRFAPRPELATWVLLAATLSLLFQWRARPSRAIWALPAYAALWANLHGGLSWGMFLCFLFAATEGLQTLAARRLSLPWALTPRRWATLALATGAMAPAALVNPNGLHWYEAVAPGQLSFLRRFIVEWQPLAGPGGGVAASLLVLASLVVLLAASFAVSRRVDLTGIVLVAAAGVLTWEVRRNLSLFALVALGVMASNLRATRWPGGIPRWAERGLLWAGALFGVAVVGLALDAAPFSAMTPLPRPGLGVDGNQEPVRAARFLRSQRLAGNLFNDYADGGYLVWRLGDRPLFIDALNAYDADIFTQYQQIVAFGAPAEDLIRRWKIGAFVLHQPAPGAPTGLQQHLAGSPEWRLVFWDGVSLIYARDLPANRGAIRRHGYSYVDPADLQAPIYREHPAQVAAEVRRAVGASPDSPNLRVLAGFIFLGMGEAKEAAGEFAQALRIMPGFAQAYTGLGVLTLQAGDPAQAEPLLRQAARLDPHDAGPRRALAAAAEARGDRRQALAERRAAVRLAPASAQDRVRLALAYEAVGDARRAAATWREVLALNPDPQTAALARGHLAR